jgi:RNA polymerase sigma-70 factor (ECF subfamily)
VARVDDLTGLALAAQAGDDEALTALIRQTQPDVWRFCAHMAGRERADDLTQETFLRAWRGLHRYQARSSVRTWLLTIARNTSVDAIRASVRRPAVTTDVPEPAPEPSPAALVTTEQVLAGITPDRRTALFLTQILGLSYAEAADVVGVPIGTMRSRVSRGRSELAESLGLTDEGRDADAR